MRDFNAECPERPGVTVGEDLADKALAAAADNATQLLLLERFVEEAHKKDPHPFGHHNHHLCILVAELRVSEGPSSQPRATPSDDAHTVTPLNDAITTPDHRTYWPERNV